MASHFAIHHAAHQIRHGGVIIYPTETVYGLGCDPMNHAAIDELNQLKQRRPEKGLILLGHTLELFNDYIEKLSASELKIINQADKPTSWIVTAKQTIPGWLTNQQHTVAIRISQHPVVKQLCQQLNHPITSTSANLTGKKTISNALQAHKYFHDKVDAILIDERPLSGQASTIKQLDTLSTVRP